MPTVTKATAEELTALENMARSQPWRAISARLKREIEGLTTHLISAPDVDRMRQLQGAVQALSAFLAEVDQASTALQQRQDSY